MANNKYKIIGLVFAISMMGASCLQRYDWTGYYYPDIDRIGDESTWVVQPNLESLDDCRDWVNSVRDPEDNYDYECGYGCRYEPDYGLSVCKTTER